VPTPPRPGFLDQLGLVVPVIQAPMAGVATPALAAAVCAAGALGSIGLGASDPAGARRLIAGVRQATDRPFNVNVFVHAPPIRDPQREAGWLAHLAPHFEAFGAVPPASLQPLFGTFDDQMLAVLVDTAPAVVSFHFGLPDRERVAALRDVGALLLATVTNVSEGLAARRAGIDAIVAQGIEAGGHRGVVDPTAPDAGLSTSVLTRLLVTEVDLPVIAAGGIMDGAGVAAALDLGAVAAQLGTAFIACHESAADAAYRAALLDRDRARTVLTTAISGRPARCLVNRMTELGRELGDVARPDFPVAYDAARMLHTVASARGEFGYAAHWAGQGAPLARSLPAGDLVGLLVEEQRAAGRLRA